jgi:multicomponent Na+:H+ antiporter subunit G
MAELIGSIVILIGAVFLFSAGLGMFRMPDAFTRIQAGTKASTLGNTLVLVGIAFYHPEWSLKLLIVVYFALMTNPISSPAPRRRFLDAPCNPSTGRLARATVGAIRDAAGRHRPRRRTARHYLCDYHLQL